MIFSQKERNAIENARYEGFNPSYIKVIELSCIILGKITCVL